MKVTSNLEKTGNVFDRIAVLWRELARAFNGLISFGDGTNKDNIDCVWANGTSPGGANTEFSVTHDLGRVPVGYILVKSDKSANIYDGPTAWTTSLIYLKADQASVAYRLLIF